MDKEEYKFWDKVAGSNKAETGANSALMKHINSKLRTCIMPGDTVLDFGCGTGIITLRIARNAKKVYGVDVSQGMLKRAQQNSEDQKANNVAFIKITKPDEMFPGDSFQVVTIFNVLQYVEDRKVLFEQFYKLLQPQGTLIMASPCFGDMNSVSAFLVKCLRFFHILPEIYYFRVGEMEKEIADAGFTVMESVNLSDLPERFIVAKKIV